MVKKLCIAPAIVTALCGALYRNYGTTMAGLWAEGYYFDHDDYHEYVHGRLPWHNLHPYPVLRELLRTIACFQEAIQLMQLDPSKTLFFDDSARNILGGKRLNCRRCWWAALSSVMELIISL
uniref:Uncharacterized protein n=1 Tax=Physcomitrium patens TaxID=3218 RepID=A0A7I4E102_PHYPA